MKQYEIKISQDALNDLNKICDFFEYTLLSPKLARKHYNSIVNAIMTLDIMPERCPIFGEDLNWPFELRKLIVDNYIILYSVESNIVKIISIFYASSDINTRLKKRR